MPEPSGATARIASSRLAALLWGALAVLFVAVVAWPILAGVNLTNDEAIWLDLAWGSDGFADALRRSWEHRIFRLPDLAGGFLSDPGTLETPRIMVLQVPGALLFLAALWVAARRLAPRDRLLFPIAALWLLLHTATTISLWTVATISTTWCAAVGAWLGIVLWTALDRWRAGAGVGLQAAQVLTLCIVGVNVKENFYGWAAAGGLTLALAWGHARLRRRRPPLAPLLALASPLVLVPAVHLALRALSGGLGSMLVAGEARHSMQFGLGWLTNILVSAAGYFAAVPVHLARGLGFPTWMRPVPVLGIALFAAAAIVPWLLARRRPTLQASLPPPGATALVAVYSFVGVCAVWPSHHVGETYLMGPNGGAALLVAAGGLSLWRHGRRSRAWRAALTATTVVAWSIGFWGLAARGAHYRYTWEVSATLRDAVRSRQSRLPASETPVLLALEGCGHGPMHSRYVLTPARALNLAFTERWLTYRDPERPIRLGEDGGEIVFDCRALARRPRF